MTNEAVCALLRAADRAFDSGDYEQARVILGGLMVTLGAKRRRKPGVRQAAVRRMLRGYEQRQEERERRRKGLSLPKHSPLRRQPIHWAG